MNDELKPACLYSMKQHRKHVVPSCGGDKISLKQALNLFLCCGKCPGCGNRVIGNPLLMENEVWPCQILNKSNLEREDLT